MDKMPDDTIIPTLKNYFKTLELSASLPILLEDLLVTSVVMTSTWVIFGLLATAYATPEMDDFAQLQIYKEKLQELREVFAACCRETGVARDAFRSAGKQGLVLAKWGCTYKCILEKKNLMNEKGDITLPMKLPKETKMCIVNNTEGETDLCKRATQTAICYVELKESMKARWNSVSENLHSAIVESENPFKKNSK